MEQQVIVENLKRTFISKKGVLKKEKIEVEALKGISFDIKKGEIFGLLGQNGAGKTTTIKILTTLLLPTSGKVRVMGFDPVKEERKIRPYINFVFGGERNLYWRLSARDNLSYFADLYKLDKGTKKKRIEEVLELVKLTNRADEKVETYSKGMKQRLQIARGLINDPEIIFLDEPTIGLDPIGAKDLRMIVKNLQASGKTILLTTHYMYEADELSDRIGIMKKGELITLDTPANIKRDNNELSVIVIESLGLEECFVEKLKALPTVERVLVKDEDQKQYLELHCHQIAETMKMALDLLKAVNILNVTSREATLEDTYIKLIGE